MRIFFPVTPESLKRQLLRGAKAAMTVHTLVRGGSVVAEGPTPPSTTTETQGVGSAGEAPPADGPTPPSTTETQGVGSAGEAPTTETQGVGSAGEAPTTETQGVGSAGEAPTTETPHLASSVMVRLV